MNLSNFSMEELILAALKSEIESKNIYERLANITKNFMLKDKFKFLAAEEEKHRIFFDDLYMKKFQNKKPVIPKTTPVPLPEITFENENVRLSEILSQAMNAEKAAMEFYEEMAKLYENEKETYKIIKYFSMMEYVHYSIIDAEKKFVESYEDVDIEIPMIHIGP